MTEQEKNPLTMLEELKALQTALTVDEEDILHTINPTAEEATEIVLRHATHRVQTHETLDKLKKQPAGYVSIKEEKNALEKAKLGNFSALKRASRKRANIAMAFNEEGTLGHDIATRLIELTHMIPDIGLPIEVSSAVKFGKNWEANQDAQYFNTNNAIRMVRAGR